MVGCLVTGKLTRIAIPFFCLSFLFLFVFVFLAD